MAVLIVDDEASTRDALKNLLARSGFSTILEARNGQEGLKILAAAPARVDLIVADWEMPQMDGLRLLKELAQVPAYDLIPFLLITSDLSDAILSAFHDENPRLDHHLVKPFRMKALVEAMAEAARRRAARRSDVLALAGSDAPLQAAVTAAFASGKAGHWKQLKLVSSQDELALELAARGARVGCVLIAPQSIGLLDFDWLSSFKKSPIGTTTPLVALSREPLVIRPIRTQCQYYVELPATKKEAWETFFAKLSRSVVNSWEVDHLLRQLKALAQQGDYKAARKQFNALFKLDDYNSDSQLTAGEICEGLEDIPEAARHYRYACEVNPCIPRCYIKLLALEKSPSRLAEMAAQFCPGNVDVLLAAARAWHAGADTERARETVQLALTAAPGNAEALAMLERLK